MFCPFAVGGNSSGFHTTKWGSSGIKEVKIKANGTARNCLQVLVESQRLCYVSYRVVKIGVINLSPP
jgi:hypothetical protein